MWRHILNKTKTFQCTHFTSCRPQSFNGFALQTPLKQLTFEEIISIPKTFDGEATETIWKKSSYQK